MKTLIFFISFISSAFTITIDSFSQAMCTHSNVECGFLPATNESDHSGLVFYKDTSYEVNVTDPIFVRIYVHAIRTDSCTGGLTDSQIIAAIEILRKDFKNAGIYFLWDCEVDCLPDDDEYSNAGGERRGL